MGTVAKETERNRLITIRSGLLEKKIASLFQKKTKNKKRSKRSFLKETGRENTTSVWAFEYGEGFPAHFRSQPLFQAL